MSKSVRTALAAALAALGAALFAAPANAAPEGITVSADVRGNTVVITIVNDSDGMVACEWYAPRATDPFDADVAGRSVFGLRSGGVSSTAAVVGDGPHRVEWRCMDGRDWMWGTLLEPPTAEPILFTTPSSTNAGGFGSLSFGS
ncbi:hypothetical protein [Rhodococcus xishaensis]|uniref:Secreted protein n=1 Tax=Rhodococcus xishaensis TaxID=2487364 RepID=A0A438ATD4_9NOCA|nr:hypothetical protein [Rhodococcus xishaensis]RVW01917.1 hypothetical protein EGT50_10670 [Rhodococcus xishaensis]